MEGGGIIILHTCLMIGESYGTNSKYNNRELRFSLV